MRMSRIRNLNIGTKLGGGFFICALILTAVVLTTVWRTGETREVTTRVAQLRGPTIQATLAMTNGVNRSLAGLKGWMLLGKEVFKNELEQAWEEIDN